MPAAYVGMFYGPNLTLRDPNSKDLVQAVNPILDPARVLDPS